MKTRFDGSCSKLPPHPHILPLAISCAVLLFLLGCASPAPVGMTRIGAGPARPIHLEPGPIALAVPDSPAALSFQPPPGNLEIQQPTPSEASAAMLGQPLVPDAGLAVGESAVRFVLTPFAAAGAAMF